MEDKLAQLTRNIKTFIFFHHLIAVVHLSTLRHKKWLKPLISLVHFSSKLLKHRWKKVSMALFTSRFSPQASDLHTKCVYRVTLA